MEQSVVKKLTERNRRIAEARALYKPQTNRSTNTPVESPLIQEITKPAEKRTFKGLETLQMLNQALGKDQAQTLSDVRQKAQQLL